MLGDDLARAVIRDIHDAAADRLAVGKVDEDVVAWSPTCSGSSTSTRMRRQSGQVQGSPAVPHTCHTAGVLTVTYGHHRPTVTSGETPTGHLVPPLQGGCSRALPLCVEL